MKAIDIAKPCFGPEEFDILRQPLETGWVTQGPLVAAFEGEFADLHHVKHGIATTSCTTALHLALLALEVGPGDEVIVPSFTWVSTANVVEYCGAKPVFVDVDINTFNMSLQSLEGAVTEKTRAVIPVHLFGRCVEVDEIRAALPGRVAIVEDAACGAGAMHRGHPAGGLGDVACFSFHPRKVISTGEGGMVTTNDDALAEKIRCMRNHGASVAEEDRHQGAQPFKLPAFDVLGYNYRMTDLQGGLGLEQTRKLTGFVAERAKWAAWYREELGAINWLRLPQEPENGRHGWQAFVCYVDPDQAPMSRDEVSIYLTSKGIGVRPGTHAIHELGYYKQKYDLDDRKFSNSSLCARNTLALPLHNNMTEGDFSQVVEAIRGIGHV